MQNQKARSAQGWHLGEYGADAFNAKIQGEDQAAQAKATKELTEPLLRKESVVNWLFYLLFSCCSI